MAVVVELAIDQRFRLVMAISRFCELKRHIGSPVERDIHLDVVLRVRSIFRDIV